MAAHEKKGEKKRRFFFFLIWREHINETVKTNYALYHSYVRLSSEHTCGKQNRVSELYDKKEKEEHEKYYYFTRNNKHV